MSTPAQPLNILFLMTDQHRLDHAGFSGCGKLATPNLDRLAESVGFTCCQTVNPICTPARTALLTGKYTRQIGTLAMAGDLDQRYPTYPQALQRAGYHTSGIGKFHFLQTWPWNQPRGKGVPLTRIRDEMRRYGFDEIWETSGKQLALRNYCDHCEHLDRKGLLDAFRDFVESAGPNANTPDHNPDQGVPWPFPDEDYVDIMTADKIIERIESRPADRPFFIFGSFCSPHKPFDPPAAYLERVPYEETDDFIRQPGAPELTDDDKRTLHRQRRAYKAMILLLDDQIGRILAALTQEGLLERTLILFTSDHGEMLGDHYRIQKSIHWKESCTVPTAIRHPHYLRQARNATPVEITDLTATILDAAGLDPQRELSLKWPAFNDIVPCRSLMPIVRGEVDRIRDFSFTECSNQWQMIQSDEFKYVRWLTYARPGEYREELYRLTDDPDEVNNRVDDETLTAPLKRLRDYREFVVDHTPTAQTRWAPLIDAPPGACPPK